MNIQLIPRNRRKPVPGNQSAELLAGSSAPMVSDDTGVIAESRNSAKLRQVRKIAHLLFGSRWKVLAWCVLLVTAWYSWAFLLPRQVPFTYAGQTCREHFTLLPGLQRQAGSSGFTVSYQKIVRVSSYKIAATQLCFTPTTAPSQGLSRVTTAPFGGPVFRTNYHIRVGEPPKILSSLRALSIAVTKPIKLAMSQPDSTFRYYIHAQDKSQLCAVELSTLACGVNQLGLTQGAEYQMTVTRSFRSQQKASVAAASVKILSAVQITDSSIKQDTTVYDKPAQLTITTDKPLSSAEAKLSGTAATGAVSVPVTTSVSGTTVTIRWSTDLPREQTYSLVLTGVEAEDGSTLTSPYELRFKTSGGPKVAAASIGSGGVSPNARLVITFDQPLLGGIDVRKYASITGGSADITMQGDRQIVFALKDIPFCGAFTLRIAAGLPGQNGLTSKEDWTTASRLTCRAGTETIGRSVNGRPLTAYFYGTGDSVVLFTGGIHGSEPSGTYLLQDWIEYLDKNAYKIPAGRRVVVVPSLNPDGIAARSRYNAHNVNLDRNFPSSDWTTDIDTGNGIVKGGGGAAPFSEPESVAIANLTERLKPRLVMSYHARGSLVGVNDFADSRAIGTVYANAVGYRPMFDHTEQIMGYDLTGEYETWIGEKLGAPAVLIELPGYDGRYFNAHLNMLWKMVGI